MLWGEHCTCEDGDTSYLEVVGLLFRVEQLHGMYAQNVEALFFREFCTTTVCSCAHCESTVDIIHTYMK